MKAILQALGKWLAALNRSKVVHGVGTFFAVAVPVLIIVQEHLPSGWKITLGIAALVGVLSRAQFIWQKVVPLLDGSAVVQVKPPTAGEVPSLPAVAARSAMPATVQPGGPTPVTIENPTGGQPEANRKP